MNNTTKKPKMAIFGTGYVGLVSGACIAHMGLAEVWCVDNNQEKIVQLLQGVMPIYEKDLETVVSSATRKNELFFTSDPSIVNHVSIAFIAVGTPENDNGSANLTYVRAVATQIANSLDENQDNFVIVNKSTVPAGTAKEIQSLVDQIILARGLDIKVHVASNPEFLREGTAISDFINADRIVIGTNSEYAKTVLTNLYSKANSPIYAVSCESAELAKYASNAMLATKISFMNEISRIADFANADILDVKAIMSSDQRIGKHFIDAGIGYGGSCFPKDVRALDYLATTLGVDCQLLPAVHQVNTSQPLFFAQKVNDYFIISHTVPKKISILGLAFKPDTDDTRESPGLELLHDLRRIYPTTQFVVHDPIAVSNEQIELVTFVNDFSLTNDSDALIIATNWNEYTNKILEADRRKDTKITVVFDGRNMLADFADQLTQFDYIPLGRPSIIQR